MGDRVVTAYVDRPTAAAYYLAFDLLLARVPLRGIAPTTPAPGLDPEIAQAEAEARDLLIRAALLEAAEHGGYRREAHLCRTEGSRRSGVQPVARRSTLTQVRNGCQRSARAR